MDGEKLRSRAIPIHPIDFGLLLSCDPDVGEVIIHGGKKAANEFIEYKGSIYRQTVKEPKYKSAQRIQMLKDVLKVLEVK